MPPSDDRRLDRLAAALRRDDPRFAQAMREGRPRPPREYRRGRASLLLLAGLAALVLGIALGHGLLLAAGLVTAGAAGHCFDPHRDHPRLRAGRRDVRDWRRRPGPWPGTRAEEHRPGP